MADANSIPFQQADGSGKYKSKQLPDDQAAFQVALALDPASSPAFTAVTFGASGQTGTLNGDGSVSLNNNAGIGNGVWVIDLNGNFNNGGSGAVITGGLEFDIETSPGQSDGNGGINNASGNNTYSIGGANGNCSFDGGEITSDGAGTLTAGSISLGGTLTWNTGGNAASLGGDGGIGGPTYSINGSTGVIVFDNVQGQTDGSGGINNSNGNANYSINGATGAATFTSVSAPDTGWTANADNGDKTQVIGSNASLATLAALMNTAVAGSGTAFLAVAEKCKALEAALVAGVFPNA